MGHYAFLDENNIVIEVITGRDEDEVVDGISDWEQYYGEFRNLICKRTSYNTVGGVHKYDGIPFRKNFAAIGYSYNEERDAFIPPKPYNSWILNEDSCLWEPPIPQPAYEEGKVFIWDEELQTWKDIALEE